MFQVTMDTPIGRLLIEGTRDAVTAVNVVAPDTQAPLRAGGAATVARRQLREYFAGKRRVFDVPVSLDGTHFQRAVWTEIQAVEFGATTSYAELARRIHAPTAPRAVGRANAANPVLIIVPCHRVLSTRGRLTGYRAGLAAKEWLLKHERAVMF